MIDSEFRDGNNTSGQWKEIVPNRQTIDSEKRVPIVVDNNRIEFEMSDKIAIEGTNANWSR